MKLHRLLVCSLMCAGISTYAQQAITPEVLNQLSQSYTPTPAEKALRNALNTTAIKQLSMNSGYKGMPDTWFSNKVNSSGITDQKQSGRCWLFTGTNVIRAQVMARTGMKDFYFSQAYTFFYDQLEKSNLFLQGVIDTRKQGFDDKMVEWLFKNPLSDGGQFTGVSDLVAKYGLVPKEAMPETYCSESTTEFSSLLKRKLREFGMNLRQEAGAGTPLKTLEAHKVEMLKTVYRMLVMAYGQPPATFSWAPKSNGHYTTAPKTYTPQTFYQEVCGGEDLNANYVMLMNDPSREYNKVYEIDYDRHTYDGHNWLYLNLPIDDIKEMAIASIKDSTMMYFSCDVAKYLDAKKGTLDLNNYDYASLMGTTFGMDKKQRIQSFDSGSTHAMTLMAVDLDDQGKPKKWMVENSWGASHGFQGHLIMTDEWFNEYMFRVVVNKRYCPERILKMLNQKPVRLPAWDPMFQNEL